MTAIMEPQTLTRDEFEAFVVEMSTLRGFIQLIASDRHQYLSIYAIEQPKRSCNSHKMGSNSISVCLDDE